MPTLHGRKVEGDAEKAHGRDADDEDVVQYEPEALEGHVFSLAIVVIIDDYLWCRNGTSALDVRVSRVMTSILTIVACIILQLLLLSAVYQLLCEGAVKRIRTAYTEYEEVMYPNHTVKIWTGSSRGVPGYLVSENFRLLTDDQVENVCQIPLAHSTYLAAILLVWTWACLADLRATLKTAGQLLSATPTAKSPADVLSVQPGEPVRVVKALTATLKIAIAFLCLVPSFFSTAVLAFLGCRWLTATSSLSDVLLNGLALGFMLLLKELLYRTTIWKRSKLQVESTHFLPLRQGEPVRCSSALGTQLWAIAGVVWVYCYIFYIQRVLPEYRWDVRAQCAANGIIGSI